MASVFSWFGARLRYLLAFAVWVVAGAVAAQPSPEVIRVAVSRDVPEVTLQVHGRFTMTALERGGPIQEGRRLESVAVRAVPQGLAVGNRIVPYPGVRFDSAASGTISLNGQRLRGALEIVRQQNQTLLVVNHVSLEDYLRGVVSKEAPDYWPTEVLKAIAVAARTYALYQRFTKEPSSYDVTGDVMSQDYGGETAEKAATTRAVKATAGWLLTYQGGLFPTFYHSTCGGITEHARVMGPFDVPPLQGGVTCSLCAASPFYRWRRRITLADFGWALRQSTWGSVGTVSDVQVTKRTPTGRVQDVTITGSQRTLRLTGYDVRALFGFDRIRSPLFGLIRAGDAYVVDGHGWGHGVGLCQWGAAEMARRGFSFPEILAYYYPGTTLVHVQDVVQQPVTILGGTPNA